MGINLQLCHIFFLFFILFFFLINFAILDYIKWLGFIALLSRFTVGLRQVGTKSLFGRYLCLLVVVSLDLLPFAFTIEWRQEYRNSSDKVKTGKELYFCCFVVISLTK